MRLLTSRWFESNPQGMDPQPPTAPSPSDRRGMSGTPYAAICLASIVPLALPLALGPRSGLEALIFIVPWLAMVLVHLVVAPVALNRSWHAQQPVLLGCLTIYLILFFGAHRWVLAEANEVPLLVKTKYEQVRHPMRRRCGARYRDRIPTSRASES